jgi:glycosyltransferase involved in cell wall biosynthesis
MKRILFIAAHRPDRSPSQRFRYEQYLDYLRNHHFECELSYLISEKDDEFFYREGHIFKKTIVVAKAAVKRGLDCIRANKFDIIFIQREAFMLGTTFFERLFKRSKAKLIYDFDDAIWIHDESTVNQYTRFLKNPSKTLAIIKMCDMIFAGNQFLADYALRFNKNVVVVPTTIETNEYTPVKSENKSQITIGWSGSFSTIKHFLLIVPVLTIIREKYGAKVLFRVVGDNTFIYKELGIKGESWTKDSELDVLRQFDIGIMPLPNDEWSEGKCGLKGLQYMALEIATIMSPVGVNKEIIEDGHNGYTATTQDEWVTKLSMLIEDSRLRNNMGKSARLTIIEKYSVDSLKEKYLSYFNAISSSR